MLRSLTIFILLCCKISSAQKIQYSKGLIKTPGKGFVRLLAGVNGFHHLIQFSPNSKPTIFLFNKDLNLESTFQPNIQIDENTEVKIIQFENDYWLYSHKIKSSIHQLFKINGNGISTDYSDLLNNPVDSIWNKSTSSLNLSKIGNSLYVIANKYFDHLKKSKLSFIKIEPGKQAFVQDQAYIPFDIANEHLREITIFKNKLFVLKTGKDEKGNNVLYVLKLNITTGQSYANQFESGKYLFLNPSLRINSTDSSVLLYSMMVAPDGLTSVKPSLFIVRINESLNELVPVKILKEVIPETSASSFIVEKDNSSGWICFSQYPKEYSNYLPIYYKSSTSLSHSYDFNFLNTYIAPNNNTLPLTVAGQSNPKGIAFTILNNRLEKEADSIIKNKGRGLKTDPLAYKPFVLNNQSYLILTQKLTRKSKALVLIKPDKNSTLQSISIRPFDRYEYLLSLLQTDTDNAFVIPFLSKNEMGIMKVTLTN